MSLKLPILWDDDSVRITLRAFMFFSIVEPVSGPSQFTGAQKRLVFQWSDIFQCKIKNRSVSSSAISPLEKQGWWAESFPMCRTLPLAKLRLSDRKSGPDFEMVWTEARRLAWYAGTLKGTLTFVLPHTDKTVPQNGFSLIRVRGWLSGLTTTITKNELGRTECIMNNQTPQFKRKIPADKN